MSALLKSLNTQRQLNILCDVVLVVQREEFPAHKGILAANSNYFMAMFTTNMIEKEQARVVLKDVVPSAVRAILDYIYTGNLKIHQANVRELLEASNFLLLLSIKEACCQFLESILDVENCLTIISIADEFYCENLHQKATYFLYKEFLHVTKHEDFMKLALEDVVELFASDEIHVDNEYQLFEALANWVKYDSSQRRHFLLQLMPLVRLDFIQPGLIENSLMYKEMAKDFSGAASWKSDTSLSARKSYSNVPVVMVIGGVSKFRILDTVTCYVPSANKWCTLADMNVPRWNLNVITRDSSVLAVGGLQEVSTIQQELPYMEKYDVKANQWKVFKTPSLPFPVDSNSYRAVGLGNEILFINDMDTAEEELGPNVVSLKEERGERSYVPLAEILFKRSGHCCAVTFGDVYVIGGSAHVIDHNVPIGESTVQRYNRAKDVWTTEPPMLQPRCNASAATLDGKIYVIGGCHGNRVLTSAEFYDPKTKQWSYIAPMNTPRVNAGISVHDGKMWVIGGVDGPRGSILTSVECYHPNLDKWTSCAPMPERRRDFECCLTEVAYRTVASIMEEQQL
ncbi:hypothetical protein QZH41_011223 [Actinostola sp. cb2023]|nr:hypothetical protein QZH41_011223 [Actinostola sp. cb2023]